MAEIAARPARAIRRRRRSRAATVALFAALLVMAAGAALFARAYTVRDAVLPGVSVAGVDVGGLSRDDAQTRLQAELGPLLAEPVRVSVGEQVLVVRPRRAWTLDVAATEERAYQAGRESVLSRLGALVAPFAFTHEVEPVLDVLPGGRRAIAKRLHELTFRPVNARLSMSGGEVVVRPGGPGTTVAVDPLLATAQQAALTGASRIVANVEEVPPAITTEEAEEIALRARTLVSAPVAVRLRKKRVGVLRPAELAALVRFEPAGGSYELALDRDGLRAALLPMVKTTLREPVDATFRIVGERVRVVRSKPGTTLDVVKAQEAVLAGGLATGRRVAAVGLTALAADLTTREAKGLGIREKVSSFTTDMGESSANRIWNVHLLGDYLDGTIVRAGQTFSYNREIGPRTVERGFREGQMIWGGVLIPSIGGGVCQTATTIFNAAFEAGLPILSRSNHAFYISHYPMGRDATVSWGGPEFVFRNDLKNALLIDVSYTNATFTVTFYGTKQRRRVESTTSSPTNYTQPKLQYAVDPSAAPNSVRRTSAGGPGFDVSVQRKVYERGKLIREDDFFTRYKPENPTAIYGRGRTPPGPYFYLPSSG
ncbi:MAG: VanW family protein [Gaiellaceae bacterium]